MNWLPYTVIIKHQGTASFQYADKEAAERFAEDMAQQFTADTGIDTRKHTLFGLPYWKSTDSGSVVIEVMESAVYA